jgi:CheY-like chemotaxis protein
MLENMSNVHPRGEARAQQKVLVAEDDPDILQVISVALRKLGYEIIEARNGAEVLDKILGRLLGGDEGERPDIIIADVRMPGLSGLEILEGLRQAHWPTVCVLMTAFADQEMRAEARRLGASALFEKPFDIDDLVTVVINLAPSPTWPKGGRWH